MADASTTDPADQDPISQTFTAGNALNAKNFIDYQFQYGNLMLGNAIRAQQDADEFRNQLKVYSLQAMSRAESANAQAMAMLTAVNTKAAKTLLDPTSDALADAVVGGQGVKTMQTTPPVYQDPTNNLAAVMNQLSAVVQALQGLSLAPAKA